MKKIFILTITFIILLTGCKKNEKTNYLNTKWNLDETLKPSIKFERSNPNDSYGVFYTDSQIKFEEFLDYIKSLESNNFIIDWRYSDTKTISALEEEYLNKNNENSKFNDGYINIKMCNKNETENNYCFFMQWVDKNLYNSLNTNSPTSYSFKLETEKAIES